MVPLIYLIIFRLVKIKMKEITKFYYFYNTKLRTHDNRKHAQFKILLQTVHKTEFITNISSMRTSKLLEIWTIARTPDISKAILTSVKSVSPRYNFSPFLTVQFNPRCLEPTPMRVKHLARVVHRRVDNAIHRISRYPWPTDKCQQNILRYPPDSGPGCSKAGLG